MDFAKTSTSGSLLGRNCKFKWECSAGLSRRIALSRRNDIDDVARPLPVPGADFIFLGVVIFLAAWQCRCLAQLEATIDAPEAGKGCSEGRANQKARSAGLLQEESG